MTGCFSHCPRVSSTSRSSPTSYARSRFTRPFITLLPTSLFLHQPTRIGDEKKHRRMGRKKSRKKNFRCKIFISLACPLHSPRVHRLGRNTSGGGAGSASGSNEFRPRTFSFPPPPAPPFAHRPRIHYRFSYQHELFFFLFTPCKTTPDPRPRCALATLPRDFTACYEIFAHASFHPIRRSAQ